MRGIGEFHEVEDGGRAGGKREGAGLEAHGHAVGEVRPRGGVKADLRARLERDRAGRVEAVAAGSVDCERVARRDDDAGLAAADYAVRPRKGVGRQLLVAENAVPHARLVEGVVCNQRTVRPRVVAERQRPAVCGGGSERPAGRDACIFHNQRTRLGIADHRADSGGGERDGIVVGDADGMPDEFIVATARRVCHRDIRTTHVAVPAGTDRIAFAHIRLVVGDGVMPGVEIAFPPRPHLDRGGVARAENTGAQIEEARTRTA